MAKYTTMKSLANALLILCLLAASCEANGLGRSASAAISPLRTASRTDSNEKVFNVLQYGAKPGGKQDSALSFIRAWRAACNYRGTARLLIPMGTFLIGERQGYLSPDNNIHNSRKTINLALSLHRSDLPLSLTFLLEKRAARPHLRQTRETEGGGERSHSLDD
ncbi:hypothetical protein NC653_024278 [Populus alba x Populus x berolinensis]|uniref:Pectate lyase superfamily protein domain-containing protein n=1 Tax=Populus alba x Populus x berolinensis TaxID=444605 RepID=A0AAD6M901_9ROSI|nr:hypothetical protein NC653_024278 [Populus alba x Populus x berolinensis]